MTTPKAIGVLIVLTIIAVVAWFAVTNNGSEEAIDLPSDLTDVFNTALVLSLIHISEPTRPY